MKRLVTLFPGHLNLNGDQANLLVLEKKLAALNVEFQSLDFLPGDDLEKLGQADFVLFGHGGIAAWNNLHSELDRISASLKTLRDSSCVIMAVASGAEKLYEEPFGWFENGLQSQNRKSEFVVEKMEDIEVLGYLNSASSLPVITWVGQVLLTSLHGPVLAKNPRLVNFILHQMGINQKTNPNFEKFDRFVEKIWELEVPLANQ